MKAHLIKFDATKCREVIERIFTPERRDFLRSLLREDVKCYIVFSSKKCECGRNLFVVTDFHIHGIEYTVCEHCSFEGLPGL
jgi:hypothetical protein